MKKFHINEEDNLFILRIEGSPSAYYRIRTRLEMFEAYKYRKQKHHLLYIQLLEKIKI